MVNWTKSFEDGIALLAILHYHDDSLVPNIHELVPNENVDDNLTRAWDIAESKFDIPKLLELIDMKPPEMRSMQTYIIEMHKRLSKVQRKSSNTGDSIEDQVERLINNKTVGETKKPIVTSVTKKTVITPVSPAIPKETSSAATNTNIVVDTKPVDATSEKPTVPPKEEPKVPQAVEALPTKPEDTTTKPNDATAPTIVQTNTTIVETASSENPKDTETSSTATAAVIETIKATTAAPKDTVPTSNTVVASSSHNFMILATLFFALFAILIYKLAV